MSDLEFHLDEAFVRSMASACASSRRPPRSSGGGVIACATSPRSSAALRAPGAGGAVAIPSPVRAACREGLRGA